MKAEKISELKDGTLLFGGYTVRCYTSGGAIRHGSSGLNDYATTSNYTDFFTTPDEFFARYPDASAVSVCEIRNGEMVHGIATLSRHELAEDKTESFFHAGYWQHMQEQRREAEADGSMEKARAREAATNKAETLPVMTEETHEPVHGEDFRRWSKKDLPAKKQAQRRAVELGYEAVILHNLPGEKYGLRWSPARPKVGK